MTQKPSQFNPWQTAGGRTVDEPETTTVTIKAMPTASWERAKVAAKRQGENQGSWVARACDQLAEREAGERLILPGERRSAPVEPSLPGPVIPPETLLALMQAAHATASAGVPKDVQRHAFALLRTQLRAARGLPPLAPRKPRQTLIESGQT